MTISIAITPLQQVCDVIDPHPSHRAPKKVSEGIPFVGIGDFNLAGVLEMGKARRVSPKVLVEHQARYSLSDNLLAIGRVASIGKVVRLPITSDFYVVSPTLAVLRPHSVDSSYLYFALQAPFFQKQLENLSTGSTRRSVGMKNLRTASIPLPPLPEQKRIVAILDEAFAGIDAAIANTKKNLINARELFESYLNAVFTQKGHGWVEQILGDVCDLISGQHIDSTDYNTDQRGIGYLTGPSDFGVINPTVSKWTEVPKRTAHRGDILITVKGSGVGKINLLDHEELAISRQLMAVRAKGAKTEFLYEFLSLQFSYFQSLANGAAIPGISRPDVLNLKLSMPELSEQERIVAIIEEYKTQTQRLEAIYQQKLNSLAELKQSILQKAFAGELASLPEKQLEEAVA